MAVFILKRYPKDMGNGEGQHHSWDDDIFILNQGLETTLDISGMSRHITTYDNISIIYF